MRKALWIGFALAVFCAAPASAQDWSVYKPGMKFSDVFGRAITLVRRDGTTTTDPSLGDIAASPDTGVNVLAKTALSQLQDSASGTTACRDLSNLKLPWMKVKSAEEVAASGSLPAYCKFIGVVDKEITFEVDMPEAAKWNGKFLMGGGGGYLGTLENGIYNAALTKFYATGATDTGHPIPAVAGASWAYHDPVRVVNWGYLGTHLAAANSRAVIQAFYKKPLKQSYFYGTSGSGRQAMMEAERYPDDFEGIIAGCPSSAWSRLFILDTVWTQQTLYPTKDDQYNYRPILPASKVPMLDQAVMDKCDALDGLKDGEINNPEACRFDPATDLKLCPAGSDRPDCFTQIQIDAIAKIHRGPSNSMGQLFPGYVYGGESTPGMWIQPSGGTAYVIGNPNGSKPYSARHYLLANENLRYLVYGDPDYDLHSFNFETDPPGLDAVGQTIDSNNPDLTQFDKAGHKLIISVGWNDWAVNELEVKDYYQRVIAKSGGLANTQKFARFFMLPNVGHCFATNPALKAPNVVDYVGALENWVEHGKAPEMVIASHAANVNGKNTNAPLNVLPPGDVDRTRPICAFPKMAAYKGSGNVDDAASFTCK